MRVVVVGFSSGIGQATCALLRNHGHTVVERRSPRQSDWYDGMVFVAGHTYAVCVEKLLRLASVAGRIVVVTSEHGTHPTKADTHADFEKYARYQCMKAAQKMLVKMIAKNGTPCVDVSPAFVEDSGHGKRMNRDLAYRQQIENDCVGEFPVRSVGVAAAIVFALENASRLSGSTISYSGGWRL